MKSYSTALYLPITFVITTSIYADHSISWDGTLYGYVETMNVRRDSILNPNNQIAALSSRTATIETRLNFKLELENWDFTARPILLMNEKSNNSVTKDNNAAYFSQWQARFHATDNVNISIGREVLNWGPAQFKSLASPFYFDNGRSNPMRELSGMDNIKIAWSPNINNTITLARINKSGHDLPNDWNNSWLLKLDTRSNELATGIAILRYPNVNTFIGMYGQYTANDSLLLYTEIASSVDVKRQIDTLMGIAWTFDNGQTLNLEYMRNNHGFNSDEIHAYFNQASVNYAQAAYALSHLPLLLGKDYLHLVWQSNPLETYIYWRIMATHSITDHGNELSAYAEYTLNESTSLFGMAIVNLGNERQEFSSLLHNNFNLGIKIAFP
jgi:hypothetical protein